MSQQYHKSGMFIAWNSNVIQPLNSKLYGNVCGHMTVNILIAFQQFIEKLNGILCTLLRNLSSTTQLYSVIRGPEPAIGIHA